MKYDIVLCGVGGQGVILLSAFLAEAAHKAGLHVRQSEIHGMSQRGGAVVAHFRMSDTEIASPVIPEREADMILSMEPMEVFRYTRYANEETKIVVATEPFKNIGNYPDIEKLLDPLRKANAILVEESNNMALMGVASNFIPIKPSFFEETLTEMFASKGEEVVQKNRIEFEKGKQKK